MYKKHKIGVVIPAYNEAKLIKQTIVGIPSYVDKIIVIEDKSTDQTYRVLKDLKLPRLTLIKHEENQGVGASKIDGYKKLLSEKVDIAVAMDGDNQMDPKFLPKL